MGGFSNLKDALNEMRERFQQNADAMASVMGERELLYFASASEVDIKNRLDEIVFGAADKYVKDYEGPLSRLTAAPGIKDIGDVDIFNRVIHLDGSSLRVTDSNALAYYFKDILVERNKDLAARVVKPGAGLPADVRASKIKELDAEIIRLDEELTGLMRQATDAGLIVSEEMVAQPMPKKKKQPVKQESEKPIKVNGSVQDEKPKPFSGEDKAALRRPQNGGFSYG